MLVYRSPYLGQLYAGRGIEHRGTGPLSCTDDVTFNTLCGRPPRYVPAPVSLTFDLLTLKVVSESRVTWATSVPILVFLGLSVLDLGPMYATDTLQTSDRQMSDSIIA